MHGVDALMAKLPAASTCYVATAFSAFDNHPAGRAASPLVPFREFPERQFLRVYIQWRFLSLG